MSDTLNLSEGREEKIYKITADGKSYLEFSSKLPVGLLFEFMTLGEVKENPSPKELKEDAEKMVNFIRDILKLRNDVDLIDNLLETADTQDIVKIFLYIQEKTFPKVDEKKKE